MKEMITDPSVIRRFMSHVIVGDNPDDCWTWTASSSRSGHGQFSLIGLEGKITPAHQASFRIFIGPIPDNMLVCHTCRNKCPNPRHLALGTNLTNLGSDRRRDGTIPSGVKSGTAKLTEEDVKYIRSSPKSTRAIAMELSVSQSAVWRVLSNLTFKETR